MFPYPVSPTSFPSLNPKGLLPKFMIPDWLRKKVTSPPAAGVGVRAWLFNVTSLNNVRLHNSNPRTAAIATIAKMPKSIW